MRRLLIDASVLLSTTVAEPASRLGALMAAVEDGDVEMVASAHLLDEVHRGLDGRYFRDGLTAEERERFELGPTPPTG